MSKKPAWSWSALKLFETCPKQFYHVRIAKDAKPEESEAMGWGNKVHKALEKRVRMNVPLPKEFSQYEVYAKKFDKAEGKVFTELRLAVTDKVESCDYFDRDVRSRAVADVMVVNKDRGVLIDWKTGKVRDEEFPQLELTAVQAMAMFPSLEALTATAIYLAHKEVRTVEIKRDDMMTIWAMFQPRIKRYDEAHNRTEFPAKPSGLCGWCPVHWCEHHRKR